MRILNNYAGIGGNRKLWTGHEITAVEHDPEIAALYKELFPEDTVIIADAHEYLLNNYKKFDFIWSSPPCQSHSDIRRAGVMRGQTKPVFPDMRLWEEIIFLKHHIPDRDILFSVENVIPYYEPLVRPDVELERHLFWTNFPVRPYEFERRELLHNSISGNESHYGFNVSKYKGKTEKRQIIRNLVNPEVGQYILDCALGIFKNPNPSQLTLL